MPLFFFAFQTTFLLTVVSRNVFASLFLGLFFFSEESIPVLLGGITGVFIASSLHTRVLIPLDVIRDRRPVHWFAFLLVLSAAVIPALIRILIENDLGTFELVLSIICLSLGALLLSLALFSPWGGVLLARLRPKYTDGGVGPSPAKFAVEFLLYFCLLLILPLVWILIDWPEIYVGGLILLGSRIGAWFALYFVCERRFRMSSTQFSRVETRIEWREFCAAFGLLDAILISLAILFSRFDEWNENILFLTILAICGLASIALEAVLSGRALQPKPQTLQRLTTGARARALQTLR